MMKIDIAFLLVVLSEAKVAALHEVQRPDEASVRIQNNCTEIIIIDEKIKESDY